MTEHFAHLSKDGRTQTLEEHSKNVSDMCGKTAKQQGLEQLGKLMGLLHDMGKGTSAFQNYMLHGTKQVVHSVYGAKYALDTWGNTAETVAKQTAYIIAQCILGHHTGLYDFLDREGHSPFLMSIGEADQALYEEAKNTFFHEVEDEIALEKLFLAACDELRALDRLKPWSCGMLVKWMMSCLTDADRWDAACFDYGRSPMEENRLPDWGMLLERLETHTAQFDKESRIAKLRCEISDRCKEAAVKDAKFFTLSVPTGGGKTFAGLRFALVHAQHCNKRRIFYIIPYNTILDQNAKDIREALGEYPSILEHHSNVIQEDAQERLLTERWDSDLILTSLVHFMNAMLRKENSNIRRMHRLTNAVLVFDEIQALPIKCRKLFEKCIQFWVEHCGCTVLLCTATQPNLKFIGLGTPEEIIQDVGKLYADLKRVEYCTDIPNYTYQEAARQLSCMVCSGASVLMVVNTKKAAEDIWRLVRQNLRENGILVCTAEDAPREDGVLCVHLSTDMCSAHRIKCIDAVKERPKKMQCICIATSLIEAGVNLSFPIVVRALAGLPSIIQAGGRGNRNQEQACGMVYIWRLTDDRLENLPEIALGARLTEEIIDEKNALDLPKTMERYFCREIDELHKKDAIVEEFRSKTWSDTTLYHILAGNDYCKGQAEWQTKNPAELLAKNMKQSFRTAGTDFHVIDSVTHSVIVPYGAEGKALIAQLCSAQKTPQDQQRVIAALRRAQRYSVNLYDTTFKRLNELGAIYPAGDTGALCLKAEFYDSNVGVKL